MTRSRNALHAAELGLGFRGEKNGRAMLTVDDVRRIRLLEGVIPQKEIAARFGVSRIAIYDIHKGRRWSHVV